MTNEEFATLWNESPSTISVAVVSGQTKHGAAVRASRLRRMGFVLKFMPTPTISINERFWSKVEKSGACWIWTGFVDPKGYGAISTQRGHRPLQTHRLSWEMANGKIPDGAMVLHRCDNPRCVNPDHLFLGTAADNTHDMMNKDRGHWQENAPSRTAERVEAAGIL